MTVRILNSGTPKEKGTSRESSKKKKRRRCPRKRNPKMMADMIPLDISHMKPVVPVESSCASFICDNFSSSGSQISHGLSKVDAHISSLNGPSVSDHAPSVCTQAHDDYNDHQPFLFSALARRVKCKMYSTSFDKLPCAASTLTLCRYPLKHHKKEKRSTIIFKKKYSQGDESPRHSLSTFPTGRSFSRKFLRPRGVSVSCCRYFSEAQLIKKRKGIVVQLASCDRPFKKPTLFVPPSLV